MEQYIKREMRKWIEKNKLIISITGVMVLGVYGLISLYFPDLLPKDNILLLVVLGVIGILELYMGVTSCIQKRKQ